MELDPTVRRELIRQISDSLNTRGRYRRALKVTAWETTIRFSYILKRVLDISVSIAALIVLLPILVFTAIAIWIENPGRINLNRSWPLVMSLRPE
jgi:lipopolysaccharide/colanic/teichoic acid biosynthesis glycosyltransferase